MTFFNPETDIPILLSFILPGFIFLMILKTFSSSDIFPSDNATLILFCTIPICFFQLVLNIFLNVFEIKVASDSLIFCLLLSLISIIGAFLWIKINRTEKYKELCKKIFQETTESNVWDSLFATGAGVRVTMIINCEVVKITGAIHNYTPNVGDDCDITLSKYTIYHSDGSIVPKNENCKFLYFNSKNAINIEINPKNK